VQVNHTTRVLLTLLIALLLAACVSIEDRAAEPTPEPTDDSVETHPTQPAPTAVPSGGFLRLDGLTTRQVVLWDSALPAEFAATRLSLYRRSANRNWTRVGDLPIEGHLVADPADPDTLYLGDHPPCLSEGDPIPFYRSTDGGQTWQEVPDVRNIRPIMVWPDDHDVIIGSRCGLAISQDRGITWERHLPESEFDLTRLAVTQIGLYGVFTSEGGVSYLRRLRLDDPDHPEFDEPIISYWGPGAIHATGDRILVGEPGGIHFSDDGGRTWSTTRQGLDDVIASVDPLEEDIPEAELEAGLGIFALEPHPASSSRIFLGTIRGLYISDDSGQSWGRSSEIDAIPIRRLDFAMNGSILYVTTDDGVIVLHNP
jgi:photosystem II stability/assembly factor-like uncharacterized protein